MNSKPSEDLYSRLCQGLLPWTRIWQHSILQRWPASRADFPEEWLLSLRDWDDEAQRQLDDEELPPTLPSSLREAIAPLQALCDLPMATAEMPIDPLLAQGLSRKKQHEIQRLLPFLEKEVNDRALKRSVDIGGGMGHLARICAQELGLNVHTIDQDAKLQESGQALTQRIRRFPRERLHFVNGFFSAEPDSRLDPLFQQDELLTIGLHTCGPLALHHFRKSRSASGTMNFGCCYDRLDPGTEVNLSRIAKDQALPWTRHALFLATRGRKGKTVERFSLMKQVNHYRFAAHLFLQKVFPDEPFLILGDAPKELYRKPFAQYLRNRLTFIERSCSASDQDIEAFFQASRSEIQDIFSAHLIRSLFARPLELALLADRRLWLEEQGRAVTMLQFFDRSLSPRNIGLFTAPR